jgi:D-tyrosyl-tRNA(Tyr) deacylase
VEYISRYGIFIHALRASAILLNHPHHRLPMIGLLQRVTHAEVRVADRQVGAIETGLLVLVGVERGDSESQADRLLERLCTYRVFPDAEGRMNRSLQDIGGQLLLVSQFTLASDTRSGTRPGFSPAAAPEEGRRLFDYLVARARARLGAVQTGEFGASMQVSLTNDGPVTFWLQVPPEGSGKG